MQGHSGSKSGNTSGESIDDGDQEFDFDENLQAKRKGYLANGNTLHSYFGDPEAREREARAKQGYDKSKKPQISKVSKKKRKEGLEGVWKFIHNEKVRKMLLSEFDNKPRKKVSVDKSPADESASVPDLSKRSKVARDDPNYDSVDDLLNM